jgi:hypothetical protein
MSLGIRIAVYLSKPAPLPAADAFREPMVMEINHDIKLFSDHTPPSLERAFGYRGSRRWVAFFWGKKIGDYKLCYGFDGKSFNPVNPAAWDAFFGHALTVAMNHERENGHARKRFEFGDEHLTSDYWLLLNRRERKLYAARKDSALHYLRSVNDSTFEGQIGFGLDLFVSTEWDMPDEPIKNGALQMIDDMVRWLDKRKEELIRAEQWPVLQ